MRTAPEGFELLHSNPELKIAVFWNRLKLEIMGFSGRKLRADFYYAYQDIDRLKSRAAELFTRRVKELQEAHDRKTAPTSLQVGDILRASWGCEQTNVDAFQVVAVLGRRKVSLQEIGVLKTCEGGWTDRGKCVPDPAVLKGKPFTKSADRDGNVLFESFRAGSPWPKAEDGTFTPTYWSSYA